MHLVCQILIFSIAGPVLVNVRAASRRPPQSGSMTQLPTCRLLLAAPSAWAQTTAPQPRGGVQPGSFTATDIRDRRSQRISAGTVADLTCRIERGDTVDKQGWRGDPRPVRNRLLRGRRVSTARVASW
jgi:hypothetical protein